MAKSSKGKLRGFDDAIKRQFLADIKDSSKNPTHDLVAAIRRLSEWASSGAYPRGCNYSDLKFMYDAIAAELKRRDPKSQAGGNFPAPGAGKKSEPGDEELRCQALTRALAAARGRRDGEGADSIERRSFTLDEVRVDRPDGGRPVIRGHAAVFDSRARILPDLYEVIQRGAFSAGLADADVRALFNHNPDIVLGRSKSGTLRLHEDARGLAIEIDPPDTQAARDLMTSMERGDIDSMSFAFRVRRPGGDKFEELEDGSCLRTLLAVDVRDVSPVTYPAYEDTDVSVARSELREFRAAASDESDEKDDGAEDWRTINARARQELEDIA